MNYLFSSRIVGFLKHIFERFSPVPRILIYSIDAFVVFSSIIFAFYLRFNFSIPLDEEPNFQIAILMVLLTRMITYYSLSFHHGIVRFTSLQDIERIVSIIFLSTVIILLVNVALRFLTSLSIIPLSVIAIDFFLVSFFTIFYRIAIKGLYLSLTNPQNEKQPVAVYGDKDFCSVVKTFLDNEPNSKMVVKAFVTSAFSLSKSRIDYTKFYHLNSLKYLVKKRGIKSIIFSDPLNDIETKNYVTDLCLKENLKPIILPGISQLFHGDLTYSQFREVTVEDLLDRKPIEFDDSDVSEYIHNNIVLVTGAAGSIGSEITKQLIKYRPKKLVLLDHAESPLFNLSQTLIKEFNFYGFEKVIGCISDSVKISSVFNQFKPKIVFHAAAYKHVPMMEKHPDEAMRVNVYGTKILADNALRTRVKKFVMISTDKAVNPTNVMGASKRIAEIYCQGLNQNQITSFVITRFGNVIGSNGSVIPTFRQQIKLGGPVTITHPEITRYFMSIPEACQLVLQAGAMGEENEIFIFDMGKPIKIYDLAHKMIRLSGFKPEQEIEIKITGLRPGEKLYEELINGLEKRIETYHPRIMIAKNGLLDFTLLFKKIGTLTETYKQLDHFEIVKTMKEIVPEYKSQNSVFEILDSRSEMPLVNTD